MVPDIGDVLGRIAANEDALGVTKVTVFSNKFVSFSIVYCAQLLVVKLA